MAVLLDANDADLDEASAVVEQIPRADTLPPGTPVLVLGTAARAGSWWRRLLGGRRVLVARAPRCGALVARGYVDVGASADAASGDDITWGWSP